MESLSMVISCSLPLQNYLKTPKLSSSKPVFLFPKLIPAFISNLQSLNSRHTHFPAENISLSYKSSTSCFPQNQTLLFNSFPLLQTFNKYFVITHFIATTTWALPCLASEPFVSSINEKVSDKINLEAILVSIDDFFNRNPFFVAGCTFIWLVVIPLAEGYFRKFKFISAIDAFRKLRDDPSTQLLDIRDEKTLKYLNSPNLKILNKSAFQVQFSEDDEGGFVNKVLRNFKDAGNTTVCILDNFDGNSMKVAELLFKNGFKAAYAIKGGVRGKKGWMEIQETLLPPSVHIFSKKKAKASQEVGINGGVSLRDEDKNEASASESKGMNSKHKVTMSTDSTLRVKNGSRSLSPYPNYPDLKPPSSPTPSKP